METLRQIKPGVGTMPLNIQSMFSVNGPIGYAQLQQGYIASECYRAHG